MLADRELGCSRPNRRWPAGCGFNVCHRLSWIVDLGRPGDGLGRPGTTALRLGAGNAPGPR